MAEQKTEAAPVADVASKPQKPIVLIILVVINMLVVLGVGFMVWKSKKAEDAHPKIDHVIEGEKKSEAENKVDEHEVGKVVPLETFIVNLAGTKGRKILKVNLELEVVNNKEPESNVITEIESRKAQIRDFIIIILSSKTYDEISTKEGKDNLRNEIKDNINTFLSKGRINNVFFTELLYN